MSQNSNEIRRLPQVVINQIAAGEVIERPASVVKELLDNSIDAGATLIKVKIVDGGKKLIEVSDNGSGISKDMLAKAFEAHSTSKIESIEDLNSLLTMGFRGEALSTIVSVAQIDVVSKSVDGDEAYQIKFDGIEPGEPQVAARENGTTICVQEIFQSIPARAKFLKSTETEYRKVVDILIPYLLLHPHIHFIFQKDQKEVYNLPAVRSLDADQISENRIREVLKGDFTKDLISIFYDGDGMKISGYVAHPKHHQKKINHAYTFINRRPVNDRGIIRSVMEGVGRMVPHGEKLPFILKIDIEPSQVDINVHPRKEEVRFINPFRVYSAIERSVSTALSNAIKDDNLVFAREEPAIAPSYVQTQERSYNPEIRVGQGGGKSERIKESLDFSRSVLQSSFEDITVENDALNDSGQVELQYVAAQENNQLPQIISAIQFFKKYLLFEVEDQMWIVDQHAAAERITFDSLMSSIAKGAVEMQSLLVPTPIPLSESELSYLRENKQFFMQIGFDYQLSEESLSLSAVPSLIVGSNYEQVFKDIFGLEDSQIDLAHDFESAKGEIVATIACHNSIRSNQSLHPSECISILKQLLSTDSPYSCPHGRPIIWKMKLTEIDKNFDRTY